MVTFARSLGVRTTGADLKRCTTLPGRAVGCRNDSLSLCTLDVAVAATLASVTLAVGLAGGEAGGEGTCRVSNRWMRVSVGDGGAGMPWLWRVWGAT